MSSILGRAVLGEAVLGSAAENALDVSASTVIDIVQTAHASPISVEASSTIAIVQTATARVLPAAIATTAITIVQTLRTSPILEDATTTISIVQSATAQAPIQVTASSTINVQQTATGQAPIRVTAGTSLLETLNPATGEITGLSGWATGSNSNKPVTASTVIDIIQRARIPIEVEATTEIEVVVDSYDNVNRAETLISLTVSADAYVAGATATTVIPWQHTATGTLNANREIDTEIIIVQTATVQKVNGSLTCDYRGVTAPSLSPATLTLSWPFNTPSETVVLRNPEFGDTHFVNSVRINRVTRGGFRVIYSDPIWPKWRTLNLEVTTLKDSQAADLLAFLKQTIGQEIRLLDWKNRNWRGVIINPEAAISQVHTNYNRVELQFEGNLV